MIHVDRPSKRSMVPQSLRGKMSAGARETREAIAHFNKPANRGRNFEFEAYKEPDVVEALMKLFYGKCAYCESILATQPPDLEHYRPKSAVLENGKLKKPGYYWLAAEWTNLLPSCIDCNRFRHYIGGGKAQEGGKGNSFPLLDPVKRWKSPRQGNQEQPLLLDPCRDFPEKHLDFLEERAGAVIPANDGSHHGDLRGRTTIDVFGLNRPGLVQARKATLKIFKGHLTALRKESTAAQKNPKSRHHRIRLQGRRKELRELLTRDTQYLGMLRQLVRCCQNRRG